jgi:hypothetical protein
VPYAPIDDRQVHVTCRKAEPAEKVGNRGAFGEFY